MVEELKNILLGKSTIIKGNSYLSAKEYITPFVERLSKYTKEFRCYVKVPDQLTVNDGTPDIIYNKVNIQALFPKEDNYQKVIGMVYGLDLKKPVVKFYVGVIDVNTQNFLTFDKTSIIVREIESNTPFDYTCIQSLIEKTDNIKVMVNQLKHNYLDRTKIVDYLGRWINFIITKCIINEGGKIKIAKTVPIEAFESLVIDKDSENYISTDKEISFYDIYNSFASIIRNDDKDIVNKFEKTILIDEMLGL